MPDLQPCQYPGGHGQHGHHGPAVGRGGRRGEGYSGGRWLAGTRVAWSLEGDVILPVQGHSAEVICANFNTSGDRISTGSFDHTVSVWDTATGK